MKSCKKNKRIFLTYCYNFNIYHYVKNEIIKIFVMIKVNSLFYFCLCKLNVVSLEFVGFLGFLGFLESNQ
jgi:hypothetical protein